ncbi:hypothetical protein [Pseudoalteromonas sp. S554]|uniref:hypothetical protein n=1 Tax=Pseudoalteromonas sp. S554 TaxID=2066516 RepID=UPI00110CEAC4|nr:hypothetical protein [Pseudoalteromonas sp. S554]TMS82501.1 hypothetical protein CWB65_04785 [Pseudoalteromonas sp. S554]
MSKIMIEDLTSKLEKFISDYQGDKPITLSLVAKSNGCSVDQVRRRAGELVKNKKKSFQSKAKPIESQKKQTAKSGSVSEQDLLIKIMSRLDKIESKLDSILSDEWIKNTGDAPPDDRLCKVRYGDGKVKTALAEHLDWETKEGFIDSMVDDLESKFMKDCDDDSFDKATSETYKLYPEFKGYDLFFDGSWHYTFETEEDKRFKDAVYKRRELQEKIKHELFSAGIAEYKRNNLTYPEDYSFISEYKIIDDSNSRVIDKLAVLGRKIDGMKG